MTQGDQQHPSGTTAACSSSPKDADAAERGSNSPADERDRIVTEGRLHHLHQHHHYHQPEQIAPADGDVKTLLHFVNLASSDIKAALDKSAPTTRKSSSVDSNRKLLQKQLKQSPPPAFAEAEPRGAGVNVNNSHPSVVHETRFDSRRFIGSLTSSPTNSQNGSLHFSERLIASASLHRDHLIKSSDLNLVKEFSFGNSLRRNTDQLLGRRASNRYLDRHNTSVGREFTDMSTLNHGEGDKPDRENPVPLRKRRLPASFWQEPDRSENHKTTPGTLPGLSPLNLNTNLKFPLLSPMAQSYTDTRPTSLDKNAIYPTNDQCYSGLNLPFAPSLSNSLSSDSYLNRSLNFHYSSICSCQQHTELYNYDHGPACAMYAAARHAGETPGLFTPISATGLLSRWHVPPPPPLTADRADMCHSSLAPRVVKPIPTKSITSYPPRYHPIYT